MVPPVKPHHHDHHGHPHHHGDDHGISFGQALARSITPSNLAVTGITMFLVNPAFSNYLNKNQQEEILKQIEK